MSALVSRAGSTSTTTAYGRAPSARRSASRSARGTATVAAAASWIAGQSPSAPGPEPTRGSPGSTSTSRTSHTRRPSPMRRGTARPRISARSRRRTRRWRRSLAPILEQGGNGRTLVVVTGGPWRIPGRPRRTDPRTVCVRGDAACAADRVSTAALRVARRQRSRAARRHSADRARRDGARSAAGAGWREPPCRDGNGWTYRRAVVFRGLVRVTQPGMGAAVRCRARTAEVHRSADSRAVRRRRRSGRGAEPRAVAA